MQNFLVIKLRYIGDVVLCTPLVRSLREKFPQAKIVFLVNGGTEEILQHNPYLDEILVLPRNNLVNQIHFLGHIRSRKFDCVLDLTDGDRSAIVTAATGAPMKIGFNKENRWRGKVYSHQMTVEDDRMHMIDLHGQVGAPLGIRGPFSLPEVFVIEKEEKRAEQILEKEGLQDGPWVMIHPTARYWSKAWPAERFAALGDLLAKQGIAVALVGSEKDRNIGEKIQHIAQSKLISFMGRTSILELAALMKRCLLFIGNDGGPMHMAGAIGCPVLAIFGPTDPAVWGPRGNQVNVVYKGLDCHACFLPGCLRGEESCMKLISVDEVYGLATQMLSKHHGCPS